MNKYFFCDIEDLIKDTKLDSRQSIIKEYRAKKTGEFRCPKKREWFISGAIPLAYYAPNDLSTAYYIAIIVKVKIETKITEIKGGN